MDFALSYSFGKDSALALHKMVQQGHRPICLITTVNRDAGRSWFHGVDGELMDAIAQSLGLPLIKAVCTGEDYTQALEAALVQAKELGAAACAFGDIDIEDHLAWNRARCAAMGLDCLVPLWQMERGAAVRECIAAGFVPVIKCVQNEYLPLLGRTLDDETLALIQASGADLCGENGEYHTLVCGGPTFARPVPIRLGETLDFGAHSAVDIRLAQ